MFDRGKTLAYDDVPMSTHHVLVAAFFLTGALAFSTTTVAADPTITITYPTGTRVQVELADTPQKRSRGLMFREQLASRTGMLFVFEEVGEWSFWMKNTTVALDILWLGPDKRIVHVEENVPGCKQDPCPEYKPNKDTLYALELPAGSVKREKLAKGMKLKFDLPPR
ncbi:MAG TPA: DUF192 domain-containing protein [Nitrospirales bacterium]